MGERERDNNQFHLSVNSNWYLESTKGTHLTWTIFLIQFLCQCYLCSKQKDKAHDFFSLSQVLDGISDIRDESDRSGMRVVIEV